MDNLIKELRTLTEQAKKDAETITNAMDRMRKFAADGHESRIFRDPTEFPLLEQLCAQHAGLEFVYRSHNDPRALKDIKRRDLVISWLYPKPTEGFLEVSDFVQELRDLALPVIEKARAFEQLEHACKTAAKKGETFILYNTTTGYAKINELATEFGLAVTPHSHTALKISW